MRRKSVKKLRIQESARKKQKSNLVIKYKLWRPLYIENLRPHECREYIKTRKQLSTLVRKKQKSKEEVYDYYNTLNNWLSIKYINNKEFQLMQMKDYLGIILFKKKFTNYHKWMKNRNIYRKSCKMQPLKIIKFSEDLNKL